MMKNEQNPVIYLEAMCFDLNTMKIELVVNCDCEHTKFVEFWRRIIEADAQLRTTLYLALAEYMGNSIHGDNIDPQNGIYNFIARDLLDSIQEQATEILLKKTI